MEVARNGGGFGALGLDRGDEHVVGVPGEHGPDGAGQAVVLRLVRLEERLGHRGVDVRGHDRGNEPVRGRVPGDLHEIRVVGGVAADDGHGPLHLLHLAQQQARFGVVAREQDGVRFDALYLGQDGGIVPLARYQRVKKDDVRTLLVQDALLGLVREPLGVGGIVVQDGDLFEAELRQRALGHAALLVVARAGAEEALHSLGGEPDGCGAGTDLHDPRFVVNVLRGLGHGRAVRPDGGTHVGGDQPAGGGCGGARRGAVVLYDKLYLVPVDASGLVQLFRHEFADFLHVLPFAGEGPGNRRHEADFDGGGKGE